MSILIISAYYDVHTFYTHQWAKTLHEQLTISGVTCLFANATDLCRSGTGLQEFVNCAEYVVFYGHGEKDKLISLPKQHPKGPVTALLDTTTVSILDGRKVFAQCCHSLLNLGAAYANNNGGNNPGYIGYTNDFSLHIPNHEYFRDLVNHAVIGFIRGDSASTTDRVLRNGWEDLRDQFGSGLLRHRPDAFAAAQVAEKNRKCVGHVP